MVGGRLSCPAVGEGLGISPALSQPLPGQEDPLAQPSLVLIQAKDSSSQPEMGDGEGMGRWEPFSSFSAFLSSF